MKSDSLRDITPEACCAHLRVKYNTAPHPAGGTVGWWACQSCGQRFMPVPMGDASNRKDEVTVEGDVVSGLSSPASPSEITGKIDETAWAEVVRCMPEFKDQVYMVRGALAIYEGARQPMREMVNPNQTMSEMVKGHPIMQPAWEAVSQAEAVKVMQSDWEPTRVVEAGIGSLMEDAFESLKQAGYAITKSKGGQS